MVKLFAFAALLFTTTVAVADVAYLSILKETPQTCSSDYFLEQPCTNSDTCERDECEDLCTANSDCNFIYSLENGGCFLYSDCDSFRVTSVAGTTAVKGETGDCGNVVVDVSVIVPDISREYSVVYNNTFTSCGNDFKLKQECSSAAACEADECQAACDGYPECNFFLTTSTGGCILYSDCDPTRSTALPMPSPIPVSSRSMPGPARRISRNWRPWSATN